MFYKQANRHIQSNPDKMSNTILPKDIQVNKLKYSDVKSLTNGSKTVYINYGSEKLTVQTPIMHLPYGIGDYNDKSKFAAAGAKTGKESEGDDDKLKKYDLSISFVGKDENPKVQAFHDKMIEIEKKIKDDAFNNRLAWFRDDFDGVKTFTDKMFSPIIKLDKDKETGKVVGKYPPTMKLKLPFDNKTDEFTFDCHDMDKNELDFKAVMTKLKGAKAQLIIQLTGLWFAGGKYGCTWKVLRGKFQLANKSSYDYVEDSDEENLKSDKKNAYEYDEDLEEDAAVMAKHASPIASVTKKTAQVVIDDDDDDGNDSELEDTKKAAAKVTQSDAEDDEEEEEVEEEEEDEPSPPPPPPKKTTKKTAASKK